MIKLLIEMKNGNLYQVCFDSDSINDVLYQFLESDSGFFFFINGCAKKNQISFIRQLAEDEVINYE